MKFIDLFAGLGGFHIALNKLGHKCVFSCEKKEHLQELYKKNFGIKPHGDIKNIQADEIPEHDILCAGFPCQPFSKAGHRKGLKDKKNGDLFQHILLILNAKQPNYFILENVRSLLTHDNGATYLFIEEELEKLGYYVDKKIYSPHNIGIPQHRERLFIVGSRKGLNSFCWPETKVTGININKFIKCKKGKKLEGNKLRVVSLWQDFLNSIDGLELPHAPIWSMEFGATYPFEEKTPHATSRRELEKCKGSFGQSLKKLSKDEQLKKLPRYARREDNFFPDWKKKYIRNNREFYEKHKKILKPIVKKISKLPIESWQKFEWNIKTIKSNRKINEHFIQFRGSGVRIKKTDFFPSLVTVGAQIPIIGKEMRYLTRDEGAALQSMKSIELPKDLNVCFSALGNAVNSELVKMIAKELLRKR